MCRNRRVVFVEIFICFTDNFNTFVLRYNCVKTCNAHCNKHCSVYHLCLFKERYDFCDFDNGCTNVSRNFVKHRTRFYWVIKRNPNIHVWILGGGSCNFQPYFRGASVVFVPKGWGGPCAFYQPLFQMLRRNPAPAPTPPAPPTLYFLTSSLYSSCKKSCLDLKHFQAVNDNFGLINPLTSHQKTTLRPNKTVEKGFFLWQPFCYWKKWSE